MNSPFLVLTSSHGPGSESEVSTPVYINWKHIVRIQPRADTSCTYLSLAGQEHPVRVKETPEQILARIKSNLLGE